ncbi:MAG: fluoride efflux transporter CrcB [Candidatus Thorarchaeota archaeon]|nr:fluoride efflux transporter CrcB [Candidatus Thorarchaeota archaeon]
MREILLVGIGGFIGAILRYILSSMIQNDGSSFPWGTLVVNFIGTLLLGIVVYSAELVEFINQDIRVFLTIGVLGAFTTMSTFGLESFNMFENGNYLMLGLYLAGTILLVFLGMFVARSTVDLVGNTLQVTSPLQPSP